MNTQKKYNVIGIMSGTSMDGIDCSYIKTDGNKYVSIITEFTYKYTNNYKNKLNYIIKTIKLKKQKERKKYIEENEYFITNKFCNLIKRFINEKKINKKFIDYVGISGQTVYHDPANNISIQLGSCKKIQKKLNLKVVGNFRKNDIDNGGQGAPIGAFYHKYLLRNFLSSTVIINLGGIANICYKDKKLLIAFDLGPANVLIDDLMKYFFNKDCDISGKYARKGKTNKLIINNYKKNKYFKNNYPKSLDREYFNKYFDKLKKINKYDAINTASIMTIEGIVLGLNLLNKNIKTIILTGGGRKNLFILENLKKYFQSNNIKIKTIDEFDYNGDFLEAQAFGYLAIRSVKKLPLSLPTTTGVSKRITGGIIYK